MEWGEVSGNARNWLDTLGGFTPTVHARNRDLKGRIACDDGEDGRVYLDSNELREIAAAFVEAADWLDKRAEAEPPAVGAA